MRREVPPPLLALSPRLAGTRGRSGGSRPPRALARLVAAPVHASLEPHHVIRVQDLSGLGSALGRPWRRCAHSPAMCTLPPRSFSADVQVDALTRSAHNANECTHRRKACTTPRSAHIPWDAGGSAAARPAPRRYPRKSTIDPACQDPS